MHFRFCGGLEPPDWLLAEIPQLTTEDVGEIKQVCEKLIRGHDEIEFISQDRDPLTTDSRGAIAALRFLLLESAKYNISDAELAVELLQLGLSEEIVETTASTYASAREQIRLLLSKTSFRFPVIEKLHWLVRADDETTPKATRVELRLQLDGFALPCNTNSSSDAKNEGSQVAHDVAFSMAEDKFHALYEELTQAQLILQSLPR